MKLTCQPLQTEGCTCSSSPPSSFSSASTQSRSTGIPSGPPRLGNGIVNKYRLRKKSENYIGHLQKSIMDNVTNIYGILFIATISLVSGGYGLYHAWRLTRNSGKSAEKLDPATLPPGIFFLLQDSPNTSKIIE